MNNNIAIQIVPMLAWDGAVSRAGNIRDYTQFAWSFEVMADLAADAVFDVEFANPSDADHCVPGDFNPVAEIAVCGNGAVAGDPTKIIIPAGTIAGTICGGTIPCRPGAFVRLTSTSAATADVVAILIRSGPTGVGS